MKILISKLQEFSEYTSIHGLGRIGTSTFLLKKVCWICVCLASFSMCIFQVYRLWMQFKSENVNTKISSNYTALEFPSVTFCNLNPMSYNKMKKEPAFYQIINETAKALNINISQFDVDVKPTSQTIPQSYNPLTGRNPLMNANVMLHLRMGFYTNDDIFNFNVPLEKFLMECSYHGRKCISSEIKKFRDEYYGACYTFTPNITLTSVAGPSFALELVLDVQQPDYIPFVSRSAGVRMGIHTSNHSPYLTSNGIDISTGFETGIALRQKTFNRYAGKDNSNCDIHNTYSGILPCMEACIANEIIKVCKCLSSFEYRTPTVISICEFETDIICMRRIRELAPQNAECNCKMPCRETVFEKDIFMTSYPAEVYEFVLENTLNTTTTELSRLKDSLVSVKVFFMSLTQEVIAEELSYTAENFVSDIGGQLGLWAGVSVLSLAEVIELVLLLFCAFCQNREKDISPHESDPRDKSPEKTLFTRNPKLQSFDMPKT